MPSTAILLRRFGRQVRIFRKQKLLSPEELSSKIRLSIEEIKELEVGNLDPTLGTILLIARALEVQPADLLLPSREHNNQYYAYRYHLLKRISTLSKKDMKKAIEALHSLG